MRKQNLLWKISIISLALAWGGSQAAFAFGELTLTPGYFFQTKKFDATRIGLFVLEPLAGDFSYSSWTGTGRTYLADPVIDHVTWFTTQQDVLYTLHERVTVGGGLGYSWATPTHHDELDAHVRMNVRLWK